MKYILVSVVFILHFYSCKNDESILKPIACFNYSPMIDLRVGDTIWFSNCSENTKEIIWDFGDGIVSTEQMPFHIYSKSDTFSIKLIAINNTADTVFKTIAIKEKPLILPDNIIAGSKSGKGISYYDFEPDKKCSLNPWEKLDASFRFDFNNDGKDDFIFYLKASYPGMLGSGFNQLTLKPLNDNEICVQPSRNFDTTNSYCQHLKLNWVDTLTSEMTINGSNLWTQNESLLSYHKWVNGECSISDGVWEKEYKSSNKNIGIRIAENDKLYYGWIGISINNGYEFTITDYAITQVYLE